MTILQKKIEELKDRESRQFFYEEHIETALPIQIRELRKKRRLTQVALATVMECDQSNISDWENPNYEYTPQIGTLKRLANAFDVPLIIRFGSWQELLEWDKTLSSEKVAPLSFDEFLQYIEESNRQPARRPESEKVEGAGNRQKVNTPEQSLRAAPPTSAMSSAQGRLPLRPSLTALQGNVRSDTTNTAREFRENIKSALDKAA